MSKYIRCSLNFIPVDIDQFHLLEILSINCTPNENAIIPNEFCNLVNMIKFDIGTIILNINIKNLRNLTEIINLNGFSSCINGSNEILDILIKMPMLTSFRYGYFPNKIRSTISKYSGIYWCSSISNIKRFYVQKRVNLEN